MKTYTINDIRNYPKYHKELWTWLANNPDKNKEDWFLKYWKGLLKPHSLCFGCEIALRTLKLHLQHNPSNDSHFVCKFCKFTNESLDCCFNMFSEYKRYKEILFWDDGKFENVRDDITSTAKKISKLDCRWMTNNFWKEEMKIKKEHRI